MAVITVSRQLDSSGEEVARILSERLGFTLIDRPGLEELVLTYGLDQQDLDVIQERPPTLWQRLHSDRKLYGLMKYRFHQGSCFLPDKHRACWGNLRYTVVSISIT